MEKFSVYVIPKHLTGYWSNLVLGEYSYERFKEKYLSDTFCVLLVKGKEFSWSDLVKDTVKHLDFPEELTKDSIPTELTDLIKQKNLELYIVDGGGEKKPVPLQ